MTTVFDQRCTTAAYLNEFTKDGNELAVTCEKIGVSNKKNYQTKRTAAEKKVQH